ncbi:MAG: glycosyltransferase family 2 protein [Bacteriovoracaceae bacterium]|nr:glycosyltransferase family 2 protein [Bacteriovoracaceae bacterium]
MKILLAIPCFNCAPQIRRVLESFSTQFVGLFSEIILIDNQSRDNTVETIVDLLNKKRFTNVKLVRNKENYGLGGSFKLIVEYAIQKKIDYLMWFHGDDQAEVSDAGKFVIKLKEQPELDVIFGARFMPGSTLVNYAKIREYGNKFINLIYSIFLKHRIYEIGSGLNVYKVQSLPLSEIPYWPDHIAFDIKLLFHFTSSKYLSKFLPIIWKESDQVSNAKNIQVSLKILMMLLEKFLDVKEEKTNMGKERGFVHVL